MAKKKKGGRRTSLSDFADDDAMLHEILVGTASSKARAMVPPPAPVSAAPTTPTIVPSNENAELSSTIELVSSIQESSHKPSVDKKCQHVKNAFKAPKFKKGLAHLKDWDHCHGCIATDAKVKKLAKRQQQQDSTEALEALSLDDAEQSIEALDSESLWICLTCCEINCGRAIRKHAVMHHEKNQHSHPLAINLGNMDCWCYECDAQIVPSKNKNETIKECQAIIETVLQIRQSKMRAASATSKKTKGSSSALSTVIAPSLPKAKIYTPGLQNLGNTCFFNSVVQVLTETKSLKAILSEDQEPQPNTPTSLAARTDAGLGPLTSTFKIFLETMWRQQGATVAPRDLFMQISKKWKVFRGFRQQDSQELMRYLFDGIKQEELDLIKRQLAEERGDQAEMEVDAEAEAEASNAAKSENLVETKEAPKYVPFIDTCFSGKLVSVIVCDACKKCSYAYEDFFDMSLPVKGPSQLAVGLSPKARLLAHSKTLAVTSPELEISATGTDAEDNKTPIPSTDLPSEAHLAHIRKLLKNVGQSNSENLSILRSLNQFTAVDTLDGDNKFACENCFKLVRSTTTTTTTPGEPEEAEENIEPSITVEASTLDPEPVKEDQEVQEDDGTEDKKDETMSETTEETVEDSANSRLKDSEGDSSEDEESDESQEQIDRLGNTIPKKPKQSSLKETANTNKPEEEKFIFRKAYKRYLVSSLPPTLVLHLKRFEQSGRFGQMRKIEDHVEIPEELDMGPYFMPAKDVEEEDEIRDGLAAVAPESKKYRLYGAVVHMGTLGGGHYTNYVLSSKIETVACSNTKGSNKDAQTNEDSTGPEDAKEPVRQWIACSDTSVRHATIQEVLASRAYLLFYERL
ncbi:Ubiquitin carboxyl-terminal hydrolase 16 [Podila epicladia]|nr:Ubiquitin carboxyl-terminal hydrolase 16 [Podila epicladia]KAG0097604.1 Ubiquitin carboxyl-terminal hydrolase 16 [Podila epicladia]